MPIADFFRRRSVPARTSSSEEGTSNSSVRSLVTAKSEGVQDASQKANQQAPATSRITDTNSLPSLRTVANSRRSEKEVASTLRKHATFDWAGSSNPHEEADSSDNEDSRRSQMPHIFPIVEGGLSMLELARRMKQDARAQEELVAIISEILASTVERNDRLKHCSNLESFEGEKAPVSIQQYVRRIVKYGGCSPCTFVVGLIYLNRLKRHNPSVRITSHNFQRLFLVAVMEAAKFLDDHYYSNKHWAQIGGIQTNEINELELEFLFRISFKLHVQREDYDSYVAQLKEVPPLPLANKTSNTSTTRASSLLPHLASLALGAYANKEKAPATSSSRSMDDISEPHVGPTLRENRKSSTDLTALSRSSTPQRTGSGTNRSSSNDTSPLGKITSPQGKAAAVLASRKDKSPMRDVLATGVILSGDVK